jgi:hypothetical protein
MAIIPSVERAAGRARNNGQEPSGSLPLPRFVHIHTACIPGPHAIRPRLVHGGEVSSESWCASRSTSHGAARYEPLNSCLLPLASAGGRRIVTVEGVAAPDGTLHPVQQAMVDRAGSQCG